MQQTSFQTVLLSVTVLLLSGCGKNDGPDFYFNDMNTGLHIEGKAVIIADRNVGAENVSDIGSYLSWEEALHGCPSGYHLMSQEEAEILFSHPDYDSGIELTNGHFKFPLTGYLDSESHFELSDIDKGLYHLSEKYSEEESYRFCFYSDNTPAVIGYSTSADKLAARCVRDR